MSNQDNESLEAKMAPLDPRFDVQFLDAIQGALNDATGADAAAVQDVAHGINDLIRHHLWLQANPTNEG